MAATETTADLDEILYLAKPSLDSEEARLLGARREIPELATKYDPSLGKLYDSLRSSPSTASETAQQFGRELIRQAFEQSTGIDSIVDDRPLYWSRLMGLVVIRHTLTTCLKLDKNLTDNVCAHYERESRLLTLHPTRDNEPAKKSILLSCFDPFNLDTNLAQTNPSAVIALTLAREKICGHNVEVAVFPVRFEDFDGWVVENTFTPLFRTQPRLVLTMSMGRDQFDLERFPGRRRSSTAPDNRNKFGRVDNESVPSTDGPEFLEFTLPAVAMSAVQGHWSVVDNRRVQTVESGKLDADSLDRLAKETAIAGSGGGFLSNEISYRSRLLHVRLGEEFPLGHLHVPRISAFDSETLSNMTSQTRSLIVAALESN